MELEQLKYPIGRFVAPDKVDDEHIQEWIGELAGFPQRFRETVSALNDEQLDTPYRPGGWTLRQVVHHVPDSHMNAYIRFKLAVTESEPEIRPYHEELWAETGEAKLGPVGMSLDLLESLHVRWAAFLRTLTPDQFSRTFFHPASQKLYRLDEVLAFYIWHGNHHLGHLTQTIRERNW